MTNQAASITVTDKGQIEGAANWLSSLLGRGLDSGHVIVQLLRPKRNVAQNRLMWALLGDIARQLTWPIQGGRKLAPEHWKLLMMSAYKQEVGSVVMGINGEPVNLSLSTSKLTVAEFSELIELIYAQGAEWRVTWSDQATQWYEELANENNKR